MSRVVGFGLALWLVLCLHGLARAQVIRAEGRWADGVQAKSGPALGWNVKTQGAFVVALCRDERGDIWAGTEDKGVWRYTTRSKQWTQFTTKDGLGDDHAYALAADRLGRVWVGHLNHGLSVWNGQKWRNYAVGEGPPGERVFALATSPVTGDVWVATNAGLARYALRDDSWSYRTRADGLPADGICALAIDDFGNLYAGTLVDGLAIGTPDTDFRQWNVVRGPRAMTSAPTGKGLPGNQINAISVGRDDLIAVATTRGLALSRDRGDSWNFERGSDWKQKLAGLLHPVAPVEGDPNARHLSEDYVTSVTRDGSGRLWLGFRRHGYEVRVPGSKNILYTNASNDQQEFPYVSVILPLPDSAPLLGIYGEGLRWGADVPGSADAAIEQNEAPREIEPLPSPAKVWEAAQLQAALSRVQGWNTVLTTGDCVYEGQDWRTQGDWVGHYGRQRAILCAAGSPFDHEYAQGGDYGAIVGQLGPHRTPDDSLRHWLHWKQSELPKVLYDPMVGVRRQAEWDDHGETYPLTWDGPDVWATLHIPNGTHRLSLYFMNKDGHDGNNRMRDYLVEVRRAPDDLPQTPAYIPHGVDATQFERVFADHWKQREGILQPLEAQPPLATARVRDFWGGVYHSFIVQGPANYWVKIGRNSSFNTIVSAIMVDKIHGPATIWEKLPISYMGGVRVEPPDPDAPPPIDPFLLDKILAGQLPPKPPTADAAEVQTVAACRVLWDAIEAKQNTREFALEGWPLRLQIYRAAQAANAPQTLLTKWRWQLNVWTGADRTQWQEVMQKARKRFLELNPTFRDADL